MTTLLKGGTIITGAGQRRADLLLDGEKIAWMGRGSQTADQVVDVTGCFLFPGFIDAHTHFDLDVANTTTADDFYTGTRAALRAAPPRSSTSPAPTRASPCTTAWTCGIRRQTAGPSATMAST